MSQMRHNTYIDSELVRINPRRGHKNDQSS